MTGAEARAAGDPRDAALLVPRPAARADRLDALLWLAGLLLLALVPVGRVSGDGFGYALRFAAGDWRWNPNHLLFEPAGAAWHALFRWLGSTRPVVDQLKLLSLDAGAVAAALFRWSVARRLAERRWSANYATAWLVLGSTYARLLVGDEFHMVQMPFLVAFAAALLSTLERPSFAGAAAAGAWAGAATLFFASNVLLGIAAAVVLAVLWLARGARVTAARASGGVLAGLLLTTALVLVPAWRLAHSDRPLASWLSSYAGGETEARTSLVYGLRWTAAGVETAATRALYGAASAAVDLEPAVSAARDQGEPGRAALVVLAWLCAAAALGGSAREVLRHRAEPEARAVLVLQAIWWPAILVFGFYWNNSEGQFYLQLAVALGALMARPPKRSRAAAALLLCGALALAWNAADVARRDVLYPRAEWTAELRGELAGAGLVVAPGWDDASILLALAGTPAGAARLTLTELAVAMPAKVGLARLSETVRRCLASGHRVDLVDIYDGPPRQYPWKFLGELGYRRAAVQRALAVYGADRAPRSAGPFRVRSIRPPARAPAAAAEGSSD